MPDVLFSDGTVSGTKEECLQQQSFIAKDTFGDLIDGGNYPLLSAIKGADVADGKFTMLIDDNPESLDQFVMRFRIADATADQTKNMLRLLMGFTFLYGGTLETGETERIIITQMHATKWANAMESHLGLAS